MQLAQKRLHATGGFAGRLEDKQIHYGLVFMLPAELTAETGSHEGIRKGTDLNTHSRHGTLDDWYLGPVALPLPAGQAVLLIPRTWLIRNGYLPRRVLFLPYCRFALRNLAELQQHFWLESDENTYMKILESVLEAA